MGVIANHGRFSRGAAISSLARNIFFYETKHLVRIQILVYNHDMSNPAMTAFCLAESEAKYPTSSVKGQHRRIGKTIIVHPDNQASF